MKQKPKGSIDMKRIIIMLAIALAIITATVGVYAESLTPALDVLAEKSSLTVSGITGESVYFSEDSFGDAALTDDFDAVTVLSLPNAEDGVLMLNDAAVCANQVISRASLSALHFDPAPNVTLASFDYTFDHAYTMECSIVFTDRSNSAPIAPEGASLETFSGVACSGCMRAGDPDGDDFSYEITSYPEKGTLDFNSVSGEFVYTPTSGSGSDSFSYRVRDSYGAYSQASDVFISITRDKTGLVFNDMKDSTAYTAAASLTDMGIIQCSSTKSGTAFEPEKTVSRMDFLVSAMDTLGAGNIPHITDTGFADNDDIPEKLRGYVYSAAKLGIISGIKNEEGETCFMPDKEITRGQAATVLNNIIGYTPTVGLKSADQVPSWAGEAVNAMYELGIYDLKDGKAEAGSLVTREDQAKMLFSLASLVNE